jgi:hypothetical protein
MLSMNPAVHAGPSTTDRLRNETPRRAGAMHPQLTKFELATGGCSRRCIEGRGASGPMSVTSDVVAPNCEGEACLRRTFTLQGSCVGGQA